MTFPKPLFATLPFKDGHHCAIPDGTLARRTSRQVNLHHTLAPIVAGRCFVKARQRALPALSRAIAARRLSPERARMLTQISWIIEQNARFADQESFTLRTGPAWEGLRRTVDDLDSYRARKKR